MRAVREALSLAYDAHAGQRRRSGEPFITHPVEVTRILAELQMDHECLAAGVLPACHSPLAAAAATLMCSTAGALRCWRLRTGSRPTVRSIYVTCPF